MINFQPLFDSAGCGHDSHLVYTVFREKGGRFTQIRLFIKHKRT
jgi:hypothetical protein